MTIIKKKLGGGSFFPQEGKCICHSFFMFMKLMQICFVLFLKNNEEYNLDQKLTWNFLLLFDTKHLHFMTTDLFQLNLIEEFSTINS